MKTRRPVCAVTSRNVAGRLESYLLRHVKPRVDVGQEGDPLRAHLALLGELLVDEASNHGAPDLAVDLEKKKKTKKRTP